MRRWALEATMVRTGTKSASALTCVRSFACSRVPVHTTAIVTRRRRAIVHAALQCHGLMTGDQCRLCGVMSLHGKATAQAESLFFA